MGKKDSRSLYKTGFHDGLITLNDDQLHKVQHLMLDMLKDFIRVTEKYNLQYSLGGGSVLGTVRHGGFIPWDDDIDINMPRRDYMKFSEVFESELGDKYILCSPANGNEHGMASSQMELKNTRYRSFNELSKKDPCIPIDIFVIENTYNNKLRRKVHGFACLVLGYILTCRKTYHDYEYLLPYIKNSPDVKKAFDKKKRFGALFSMFDLDSVCRSTDRLYSACKDDESEYITIPTGRKHYFGEMYLRADVADTVLMDYEDIKVNVPKNYNLYLKRLYGEDYMTIPPREKIEQHPIMELEFPGLDAE